MAKYDTRAATAHIAVLGYEGCSSWVAAGLLEMFAVANVALRTLAPRARAATRVRRFDYGVIAASDAPVRGAHGVRFEISPLRRRYDVVIVPPIWCESRDELIRRAAVLRDEGAFLQRLSRRTGVMASACSGAVLLARAGLLEGRKATTCWWLASWFASQFPGVRLAADKLVVADADRWTAAAGSAYLHLGVDLIGALAGAHAAAAAARLLLVERRRGSQSPFMAAEPARVADPEVERAIAYLERKAASALTIPEVSSRIGVSGRTLARRFKNATGSSPLAYLQSRRIGRARELLETTALPLADIVERCGYEDLASFRKLFARQVGMTPREYRSRFARI